MVRILNGIGKIIVQNHGGDGRPFLSRQLLQLLSPSWIINYGYLSRVVDVELTIIYETLNL